MNSLSRDHAQTTTSGKGTLTLAALTAALLVSGCIPAGDNGSGIEPILLESGQRLYREVATGCVFQPAPKAGMQPLRRSDGSQVGCTRGSAEGVAAPVAGESSREEPLQAKEAGQ